MCLTQKYFSFAEIVQGRDASVRVTHDGLLYAVDLVMVVTGKSRDDAGWTLRNIPEETFPSVKITDRKMPGKGNAHTKLLTFSHAIELVMVLPGQVAKETRVQFRKIIERYLAGDHTLISEIQANAASASPVSQMARESLGIATDEDLAHKRRKQDTDIVASQQQSVLTFMDAMERLDPDWKRDTRLVMQTKDHLKNITLGPQLLNAGSTTANDAIYICDVARKLGFGKLSHGQPCAVGRKAAELYREKHQRQPPQRKQFVDGAERLVAAYTEADRDILERAVKGICVKIM
jgi:hypothetical protein